MIAISARIEMDPADADAFAAEAAAITAATRAEKGCQRYAFAREVGAEQVLWVSEEWDSVEDLHAHLRSGHIRGFLERTAAMRRISMDARMYEVASVGPVTMPE